MTDTTEAIIAAVRAEERANTAHERLDRMNGSIDALRKEVSATNGKIDMLLARESGAQTVRTLNKDSRRFVITTFILAATAIAAFVLHVHISIHG